MKIGAVMFFTSDSMQPAALGRELEVRGFGACQNFCVTEPVAQRSSLASEPFAEQNDELRPGGGPFPLRHLPIPADAAQDQVK